MVADGSTAELTPYTPAAGTYDEAVAPGGAVRDAARATLDLVAVDPAGFAERTAAACRARGVAFNSYEGDQEFRIDPVPRVIEAAEWERLELALAQRVRALDAFVDDVYGAGTAIAEGVIPRRVVHEAPHYDPGAGAYRPAHGRWIGVAGLDLVRDAQGELRILEDNLRTPSGIAYALAAREIVAGEFNALPADRRPLPIEGALEMLRATLHDAAPAAAGSGPVVALLSDGPGNSAWWEHVLLSERLGMTLVTAGDLQIRGEHLVTAADGRRIDVVYRRTDACDSTSWVAELIGPAMLAGTLGVVNGFGTGVADDKLVYAYAEDLVRFYLGEEPLARSIRTFDLAVTEQLEEALDRLPEMVVKPRGRAGGIGVVVCPIATPEEIEAARAAILSDPDGHVAQEAVMLSTHPTVVDGRLRPRHVDLRPFIYLRGDRQAQVVPGGLSRVALDEGQLIVNSSRNGGAKDTWVVRG